ncbi:trifunctional aldehyde reductase/carbonyl reductase (NADPH)/glucose 1-dehydrogenase (NADP(+)) YPR1 [Sugiyamaella lignohabitans]|uniref:Trifunctional aldehyde reductase/carbonyl reductase (NADPH)/glucose 1-dehydrogenase (NADP(+)) YPR1 n=1 Tax=Sugiyamaella lignohabitans TaxID=796027 RepID=A0A167DA21_9ASCO|nr:trifunctional aldehyde reductase/carbonyl reductase (NADPH)/glucose 1-dehydrogenase (NADP(+)) YPR1 [Sugiyamaella lignohabitans]ANB12664.1 trifunctional aldehyde reductase/carbonyl reductase (NADPH)/glucose 1-dehydrogenase (NADP(+)) YPR1 [Sugiyamaella lignohabitans]
MTVNETVKLSSGYEMPVIGFGTGGLKGPEGQEQILKAIETGYRSFDTAEAYRNEEDVGIAIKKSNVPRKDIFIISKMWPTSMKPESVRKVVNSSLEKLGVDYIDLYLIHWPISFTDGPEQGKVILDDPQVPTIDTWRELEKFVEQGKLRSIGVSNFTIPKLTKLLKEAKIKPAVNQVEGHPNFQQPELLKYCQTQDISLMCYTPLGRNNHGAPRLTEHPVIQELSKSLNIEPATLLINWAVQRGTVVIPKTSNPARLQANLQRVTLPDSAMEEINRLETGKRNINPLYWGVDVFQD